MKKIKSYYLIIAVFLLFCVFSYFNSFPVTENNLRDMTYQHRDINAVRHSNIIIIAIDDKSLLKFGRWPWTRDKYAQLIAKVSNGRPAVIESDISFTEYTDKPENDELLIRAVKDAGNVIMPVTGTLPKENKKVGQMQAEDLVESIDGLGEAAIPGHMNVIQDENDGIVRESLNSFEFNGRTIKSIDLAASELYLKAIGKSSADLKIIQDGIMQSNISYLGKHNDYEHVSFSDVLEDSFPAEYFKNKIVLIGPYALAVTDDRFTTPLDHQEPLYGIEIHANIVQNILEGKFKQEAPRGINLLVMALLCLIVPFVFKKLGPFKSSVLLAVLLCVNVWVSTIIYNEGFILQLLYPAAIAVVVYLTMLIYRYIEELFERKRVTDVFGRYVAPQVVSSILEGGEVGLKLGGTRREITALFVDIRGFTPMSEKCQPEEVVEILNDYLHLCAISIFEFEGTLDKFIGDATMAIFNAPLDLQDHEFRACQTAWAMKQGSYELAQKLEKKFGRSVQFGIGINTGFAVVGNIGAKFRMDYTAIGDTVNTAARLESNAKPGQILLSQSTYERVRDRIDATYLGEIKVKGKENGVPIYQLDSIREVDRSTCDSLLSIKD